MYTTQAPKMFSLITKWLWLSWQRMLSLWEELSDSISTKHIIWEELRALTVTTPRIQISRDPMRSRDTRWFTAKKKKNVFPYSQN